MRFLRDALLLVAFVLSGKLPAVAQAVEWAQLAHNKGNNNSADLGGATDQAGNTYVGFYYKDSARVGGQRVVRTGPPSSVGRGINIIRYDSTGRARWIKELYNVYMQPGTGALQAGPASAGLFVVGVLYPGATWGGVPIPAAAAIRAAKGFQGFYGRCDTDGNLLWTRPLPTEPNWSPALSVDGLGNCFVTGTISPNVPISGRDTLRGQPIDTTECYLVGNTPAGTGEWSQRLHATPMPRPAQYQLAHPAGIGGLGLGPQANGGCLLFGTFNKALYFGSAGTPAVLSSRQPLNTFDTFIASVSAAGALSWIRPAGGGSTPPQPLPAAAAADAAGNYYVGGGSDAGLNPIGFHNTNISVAKYTAAGALTWVTSQPTQVALSSSVFYNYNYVSKLVVDVAGEVTILAEPDTRDVMSVPTIGNFELRDAETIIHFTAAGVPQWTMASRRLANPGGPAQYSDPVALGLDAQRNLYYVTAPGGGLTPPTYLLGEATQVGAGISVARIGTRHNTVRGRLYLDANGNGVRDGSEGAFPENMALEAIQPTRASLGTFDTQGFFNVYVGAGAYSLAAPPPPLHYALTQPTTGPYTGSFVGYGRVDTARHFGFRPIANQADVRVSLTPYGAARPGFTTRYRLTVQNVGTTTVASGTATATLDARMAYISSTPAGSRSGQTVTWAYTNLAPFARREFDVLFSLPTNTPLGTQLTTSAGAPLAADVVPADNTATTTQTVTGSFDPNDITVNYQRLTPAQVAAQLPLDYTIRFQNMGTDTAFTVVITDTLDFHKLNVASLMLVAQSHNCLWSLSGTGLLTVRFLNINLPHRNQDVIRSQGFVRFRVQPRPTLAVGEIIPNRASIVFDYNAGIRTNTATTTVFVATAALASHTAPAWETYPNPATDLLNVAADLPTAGPVRVELLDGLGRAVRQQTLHAPAGPLRQQLDLRGLAPGLYVLRLTPPTGPALSRPVVRE